MTAGRRRGRARLAARTADGGRGAGDWPGRRAGGCGRRADRPGCVLPAAGGAPGSPPAPGPEEPDPGGGPRRDRSSRGGARISPALRRLVVTPTFAAGLGVVVAAFLAANMSRTVLHFSAPIPGNQCSAGDCHAQQPHGGTLASARPGVHITPSAPAGSGPVTAIQSGGGQPGGGQPGVSQPGGASRAGPRPRPGQRRAAAQREQPGVQHHLPAGRAVAGRLRRPDHDPRAQRDQGPGLEPGLRLPRGTYRRRPGRALGAGPGAGPGWRRACRGPAGGSRTAPRPRCGSWSSWRASPPRRQAAPSTASSARSARPRPRDPAARPSPRAGHVGARFSLREIRRVTGRGDRGDGRRGTLAG